MHWITRLMCRANLRRYGLALLAAGWLLGQPVPARAASTYYVSLVASHDSYHCTLSLPCRTIGRAVEVAQDGDTVQIGIGTFEEHLVITEGLTLRGAGAGKTFVDGSDTGRAVEINMTADPGNRVTLEDLTIQHGKIEEDGAGVLVRAGDVLLQYVSVSFNQSQNGHRGGGLFCMTSSVQVYASSINNNHAYSGAGAAVDAGCQLSIESSTINSNHASITAGVLVVLGSASLTNVMVSSNIADELLVPPDPLASRTGGIEVQENGHLSLNHCTLANNTAQNSGDGWQLWAKGEVTLSNTILYGIYGPVCKTVGNAISSDGYNLSGDSTCGLSGTGDLVNSDPQVGGLTDNGATTPTHALAASSPAVDAAGPPGPGTPTYDQRGRPHRDGDFDGVVRGDIGAYEYQPGAIWLPLVIRD